MPGNMIYNTITFYLVLKQLPFRSFFRNIEHNIMQDIINTIWFDHSVWITGLHLLQHFLYFVILFTPIFYHMTKSITIQYSSYIVSS